MKGLASTVKRLSVGEMSHGQAVVTLDGRQIGRIVKERPGFYGAFVDEHAAGGGRNIPNAVKSIAAHYLAQSQS